MPRAAAPRKRKRKDWWNDEASDADDEPEPEPSSASASPGGNDGEAEEDAEAEEEAEEEEEGTDEGEEDAETDPSPSDAGSSSGEDSNSNGKGRASAKTKTKSRAAARRTERAPRGGTSRRGPVVLVREVARLMALRPDPVAAPGAKPVRGVPVVRPDAWDQWRPGARQRLLPDGLGASLLPALRARWIAERDAGLPVAPLPLVYLAWSSEWARNGVGPGPGPDLDWTELPQFERGRAADANELVAVCGFENTEALSRIACRHCGARAMCVMTVGIRRGDEPETDLRRCARCGKRT